MGGGAGDRLGGSGQQPAGVAEVDRADTPQETAERADLVLLLDEWRHYRELDRCAFSTVVRRMRVLDGRNALDRNAWEAAGWSYRALGRRAG